MSDKGLWYRAALTGMLYRDPKACGQVVKILFNGEEFDPNQAWAVVTWCDCDEYHAHSPEKCGFYLRVVQLPTRDVPEKAIVAVYSTVEEAQAHIAAAKPLPLQLFHEDGSPASLRSVIKWFLEHYEGVEHLTEGGTVNPETWYTITAILRRCLERIRDAT
jgi:hypothetical protein